MEVCVEVGFLEHLRGSEAYKDQCKTNQSIYLPIHTVGYASSEGRKPLICVNKNELEGYNTR